MKALCQQNSYQTYIFIFLQKNKTKKSKEVCQKPEWL